MINNLPHLFSNFLHLRTFGTSTFHYYLFDLFILCSLLILLASFTIHFIFLQHSFSSFLSVSKSWLFFSRNDFSSIFIENQAWTKSGTKCYSLYFLQSLCTYLTASGLFVSFSPLLWFSWQEIWKLSPL